MKGIFGQREFRKSEDDAIIKKAIDTITIEFRDPIFLEDNGDLEKTFRFVAEQTHRMATSHETGSKVILDHQQYKATISLCKVAKISEEEKTAHDRYIKYGEKSDLLNEDGTVKEERLDKT